MEIKPEGNFDDTPNDVRRLAEYLSLIEQQPVMRRVKLQLREVDYLGPFASALIVAEKLKAAHDGRPMRVVLPQTPAALKAYCEFSGLAHILGLGPAPDPRHPENENDPFRVFRDEPMWTLADGIVRLVRRHTVLSDELEIDLRTSVQEMAQNTFDHARSPFGSVMGARFVRSRSTVRVAIVDRGRGVYESLSETHSDIRDSMDALERVARGGVSARSRRNNMGLGISNLGRTVEYLGGEATLISGDGMLRDWGRSGGSPIPLPFAYHGTAVFFSIPCEPEE